MYLAFPAWRAYPEKAGPSLFPCGSRTNRAGGSPSTPPGTGMPHISSIAANSEVWLTSAVR